MTGKFPAILPAEDTPSESRSPSQDPPQAKERIKRELVAAACLRCRKAKAKCDGARPACGRCVARDSACEYDVEPGKSRMVSLKRKYTTIQEENQQLWEIIRNLRSGSESDAFEVLRRIRATADQQAVLHIIPSAHPQPTVLGMNTSVATLVNKIDHDALQRSPIRVRARPWTVVAGDGIVSELVSIFFEREHPFLVSFVDRDNFLLEMASESQIAMSISCSPLLVNIICAIGAFTSESVRKVDTLQQDSMRERFFDEFRKLLDQEHGKASLPTMQALYLAFVYSSCAGRDRAGNMYRWSAGHMFERLGLGKSADAFFKDMQLSTTSKCRSMLSRAIWGLFALESITAFLYLQPSLMPVPVIGRYFCEPILSNSWLDKTLDATSDLSVFLYDIMAECGKAPSREHLQEDIAKRALLYRRINRWYKNLPSKDEYKKGNLRQYHYLRACYHVVMVALFRPLWSTGAVLPGLETPTELCVSHCRDMMNEVISCIAIHESEKHGSLCQLYLCYCCSYTLISRLDDDPRSHLPFTQACEIFHVTKRNFPVSLGLLQGLKALAKQLKVTLPKECRNYFQYIRPGQQSQTDVPISFVLPDMPRMIEASAENEAGSDEPGIELGKIIAKWNELSMDTPDSHSPL